MLQLVRSRARGYLRPAGGLLQGLSSLPPDALRPAGQDEPEASPDGLGEAELSVYPTEATVLRGSSLLVNCSDSCEDVGLETPITKEKVSEGDTWKTFLRSGVQEDSEPLCFSNCGQQDMLLLPITVYWSPESIELAPLPPWQPVGENLTLSCQIKGGAPRSNLTAVLLRGDEVLSRQPVPGDPTKLVEVMAEVPVRREDHGANFSCRTELDLRSRGLELFENSSAPLQLRTFATPQEFYLFPVGHAGMFH